MPHRSSEAQKKPAAGISVLNAVSLPESRPALNLPKIPPGRLCRSLDLRQRFALLEPPLLLEPQDLEPLKVRQGLPLVLLGALLGPIALLPLLVDLLLLPQLLDRAGPGAAGQTLKNEGRKEDVGERCLVACDREGRV